MKPIRAAHAWAALALIAGCHLDQLVNGPGGSGGGGGGPPPPPTSGNLKVTTSTTGSNLDPDGYFVAVDGGAAQPIGINASFTFTGISTGSHSVTLGGVAGNCTVNGGATQTQTVTAGQTASITFSVTCAALTGSLTITTTTSGANQPSGYTVTVDGGQSRSINASGTTTYTGLTATSHSVQLNGVPSNCTVSEANPQTVSVPANGTARASFTITCAPPPNQPPVVDAGPDATVAVGLLYTESASFTDPDHNGPWSWTINWGDGNSSTGNATSEGTISATHTYLLANSYTITVTVTDAAGASGSGQKVVTVTL